MCLRPLNLRSMPSICSHFSARRGVLISFCMALLQVARSDVCVVGIKRRLDTRTWIFARCSWWSSCITFFACRAFCAACAVACSICLTRPSGSLVRVMSGSWRCRSAMYWSSSTLSHVATFFCAFPVVFSHLLIARWSDPKSSLLMAHESFTNFRKLLSTKM